MHQSKAQGSAIHPSFKGRHHVEYNSGEVKKKPTNGAFGNKRKPKKKQINTWQITLYIVLYILRHVLLESEFLFGSSSWEGVTQLNKIAPLFLFFYSLVCE